MQRLSKRGACAVSRYQRSCSRQARMVTMTASTAHDKNADTDQFDDAIPLPLRG
jgi:hypothetical protein